MNKKTTDSTDASEPLEPQDAPADADASAPQHEPEETAGDPAAAEASREIDSLKDRLLRLQADFDNFRKRTLRERDQLYRMANEDLLGELIPVIDHFELGLKTAAEHETDEAVQKGFRIVLDQLNSAARKFGLEPVDVEEGGAFDPHQHEALSHIPSDQYEADAIVAVVRRGYKLGDKLVRPCQVVVSSGPAAGSGGES